ncbi:MAG TPA: SDR family oxidoreductase [Ktedonosporobacter sp.]|nr:SDR family oxidoreductase [Ktedonosporobacter sp.]
MTDRLKDRVAVVTGAAQGNGKAIAEAFAREGARVVIGDISEELAGETARAIRDAGLQAKSMRVNVTKSAEINSLLQWTVQEFGRVDILVNNAGVIGRYEFLEITEEEWDRVMDINLKGTFLCGQAFARQMVKQGSGVILNIASVNADSLNPTTIHYCTSKGGVRTLTKGMALALAKAGVRVNAIGPGPVYTNLSKDRLDDPQALAATLAHIPMGRVAQPADLTGAAVFLASDEAAYVTGITLFVDGGWLTM